MKILLIEDDDETANYVARSLRKEGHSVERARSGEQGHVLASTYASAVDRAISDSDNILSVFSALLRIGQIEGRSDHPALSDLSLSALLEQLVEVYQPAAEDTGYILKASVDPSIVVQGDRELLMQMLANLIENAMAHTPKGTLILVELKTLAGNPVAIVSDTGPGVPVGEREKVLRRFYRLESARSRPGAGLGLSLTAAIAAYHNASLTLEDNGPGLKVVIELPTRQTRNMTSNFNASRV